MSMKKYGWALVLGLCLFCHVNPAWASLQIGYTDPHDLFLFEKVGKAENLIDNPARLQGLTTSEVEQNAGIHRQDIKPYDSVFKKDNKDEFTALSTQLIFPFLQNFTFNAGYQYQQTLQDQKTVSTLDESRFVDTDKVFLRALNIAVAYTVTGKMAAGFAFSTGRNENFIESDAPLNDPTTLKNDTVMTRQRLGVALGKVDGYLEYGIRHYQGYFDQTRETDFGSTDVAFHMRYIAGTINEENLTMNLAVESSHLDQKQFEIDRTGYALDFPNYRVSWAAYYDHPGQVWEGAVGLETDYGDHTRFDSAIYAWKNYQTYRMAVPMMAAVTLSPFAGLWNEMDIIYEYDGFRGNRSAGVTTSFGAWVQWGKLRTELYLLPNALWSNQPDTAGEALAWKVGMNVNYRFE